MAALHRHCHHCGSSVSRHLDTCPVCWTELTRRPLPRVVVLLAAVAALVAVGVVGIFLALAHRVLR